jgi:hypothetical protein
VIEVKGDADLQAAFASAKNHDVTGVIVGAEYERLKVLLDDRVGRRVSATPAYW